MNQIKFKLNWRGVRAILKSEEMQKECQKYADKYASAAGEGYVAEARQYPERSGAAVYPGDEDAWRDNLENKTLERVYHND